ncbi:hypothetical protein [Sphingobacterium sp. SYP-B4668]|uniref:hypothetical protein n=1 Tax=Sphingobacterium sp. SYP-B4668 TaxID=2996035 RepID=UPI0022DCECEE|nr:hypothetical protein [Sphingobacterium sp. SYP-B4668]
MEKFQIYSFLKDVQAKVMQESDALDISIAYEMVDQVIKDQDFYHQTPYFLSEWIFLKEQVLRRDSESVGYFDRFLDNILYSGDTGVFAAYTELTDGEQG